MGNSFHDGEIGPVTGAQVGMHLQSRKEKGVGGLIGWGLNTPILTFILEAARIQQGLGEEKWVE